MEPAPHCDHGSGCITCGDEAIEMQVLEVDAARGLALCANATDERERSSVEIALVDSVSAGDSLLVHAGTAIAHLGAVA
jgi:hydrogenase maturation factor